MGMVKGRFLMSFFIVLSPFAVKKAANDDDIEMGDVSMGLKCPVSAVDASLHDRAR
jgi:hypothetical protein